MAQSALKFDFSESSEPLVLSAARQLSAFLASGAVLTRRDISDALSEHFGGSDADGRWSVTEAHAALELAQVLWLMGQSELTVTTPPDLAEKVAKLLKLIPQLSLPLTIIGLIDLVIDTLRQARSLLLHLQQQMQQILGTIDRATNLEDAGLMAIAQCAQANVAQEAANVGKALASLGKLIGLINIFLGILGLPEVPDLSDLAGRPLDDVIPPLDAIVELLENARAAVPVP